MAKYLKLFSTDNDRVTYEGGNDYIEPYVSYVEGDNTVHYNKVETKLVVYYDIQDISSPTTICTNYDSSVKSIEVDGVLLDSVVTTYQFDSVGEHIIKYEFNNPTTVGNNAPLFYNLTTVKRAIIADTFTSIGSNAFLSCSSLTSITIPNGVTSIGDGALQGCSALTTITIPNSVTSIGQSAFYECVSLTSITIPNGVTSIDYSTFYGCSGLTSVTIPNSVTSISYHAFQNCSSLTSVTIGNSVASIGYGAFSGCRSLTSVTIPSSVTSICGSLGDFNYEDIIFEAINPNATFVCDNTNKVLISIDNSTLICGFNNTIAIPNSVTSIGKNAFRECSGLTSITIPDSVTSIGEYAFYQCSGLTSVTIPNSVTSIGEGAFMYCRSLTEVTIPNTVTSIGSSAFSGCRGLTSVTIKATTPPTLGGQAFYDTNNCPIYVPAESVEVYKAATKWSDYASRIQAIPTT